MQSFHQINTLLERVLLRAQVPDAPGGAAEQNPSMRPQPGDPWTFERRRGGIWNWGDEEALIASIPRGPELVYNGNREEIYSFNWLQGLWARIFYIMGTFSVEATASEVTLIRTDDNGDRNYELVIELRGAIFTARLNIYYLNMFPINDIPDSRECKRIAHSITNIQVLNEDLQRFRVNETTPELAWIRESRSLMIAMADVVYEIVNHMRRLIKANMSYDAWRRMYTFIFSIRDTDRPHLVANLVNDFINYNDTTAEAQVERQLVLLSIETSGADTHTVIPRGRGRGAHGDGARGRGRGAHGDRGRGRGAHGDGARGRGRGTHGDGAQGRGGGTGRGRGTYANGTHGRGAHGP